MAWSLERLDGSEDVRQFICNMGKSLFVDPETCIAKKSRLRIMMSRSPLPCAMCVTVASRPRRRVKQLRSG